MKVLSFKARIFLFFTFSLCNYLNGQSEDFQSWNMLAISKKNLIPNTTSSLTVIFRLNDDVSRFNDVSFDWRINRKLTGGLSAQLTFRNWTFTRQDPVYFLWYDLKYIKNNPRFKWINILRLHHGLDWVGKEQADFLRMRNHLFWKVSVRSKLSAFAGYDLWYRLNGDKRFQIIWLESGIDYDIKKLKFRFNLRRIGYFNNGPGLRRNIIVTGLFYRM